MAIRKKIICHYVFRHSDTEFPISPPPRSYTLFTKLQLMSLAFAGKVSQLAVGNKV
jgi:hypothetical protein